MQTVVVVNPAARRGAVGRIWPGIRPRLEAALGDAEIVVTAAPRDATAIVARKLRDGAADCIVVVGGDGTLNEALNGWFDADRTPIRPTATLAPLMLGTGGDFRRTLNTPTATDAAIARIATAIAQSSSPSPSPSPAQPCIDVGHVRFVGHDGGNVERYFINIASFGMGGAVAHRVNRSPLFKRLGGKLGFYLATLTTLLGFRRPVVQLRITSAANPTVPPNAETADAGAAAGAMVVSDVGPVSIRNVAIANGQFHGGGMWMAPHAVIDDGHFDVVIVGPFGAVELIRHTSKFYSGRHLAHPKVSHTRAHTVHATVADSTAALVALEIDGEPLGRLPATFTLLPAAVPLIF